MKAAASGRAKYFHGELSDGKRKSRVVGFDSKIQQKLLDFHDRKEPVVVVHVRLSLNWRTLRHVTAPVGNIYRKFGPVVRLGWLAPARQ